MSADHPPDTQPDQGLPDRIGPYHILDVLGEGGMGVVYRAEQTAPVRRRVALKIIKLGMDTKQVVARFESERQALAVMDHPGIAKVFDGGVTETGRPYFVMELVHGVPITDYCDTHKLSTTERVQLLTEVCAAVQHAHQKGVIHRDLKPTNILVALQDGRPGPKIIDFGIAKAMGSGSLTQQTLVTRIGQMVGTPAYMSPEQAEMSGLDVDTRTDIYSLGVILYELLVGAIPLDFDRVLDGAVAYKLRDTVPPKPSTRFSSLQESWDTLATLRRTDPQSLRKQLRGDLDWIVMMAMEQDRTRRYETANGLAMDLERHARHEPVLARPPSAAYRIGKFVRRNRPMVALGTALAASTVLFATTMAVQAGRIARERDRAEQEAETAEEAIDFMVDLFQLSDPSRARGNSVTAREVLDRGVERIGTELADQPVVRGRLLDAMGAAHTGLGLYSDAEPLYREALDTRSEAVPGTPEHAQSLSRLAWLYQGQQRLDEALPMARESAEIIAENEGPVSAEYAYALQMLGMIERDLGDFEVGRASLERSLEIRRSVLGPEDVNVGWSLYHLGWLAYRQGDYAEAGSLYEEALPLFESGLAPDDPSFAWVLNDMAVVRFSTGDLGEARDLHERALAVRERILGPDHPDVAQSLGNLANVLWDMQDHRAAIAHRERALAIEEKVYGLESRQVASTLSALGLAHQGAGEYGQARVRHEKALEILEGLLGPDDPGLSGPLGNLGFLLRYIGDFEGAEPLLDRALRSGEIALGPTHPRLISPLVNLGFLYRETGRPVEGLAAVTRAFEIGEETYGPDNSLMVGFHLYRASLLTENGQHQSAFEFAARAREMEEASEARPSMLIDAVREMAFARLGEGRRQEADSLFQAGLDITREAYGEASSTYAYNEARYRSAMGDRDEAFGWMEAAVRRGMYDPILLRNPELNLARTHPGFEALAREIRLQAGIVGN